MSAIYTITGGHTHADGVIVGTTGEKVAFLGATPVARRAGTSGNQDSLAAITGGEAPTEAEHNAVRAQLREIRATLVALGLWTGADAS